MPNPAGLERGGLIDVHTHALDPELPDLNGRYPGRWPRVRPLAEGRAAVLMGERPYRNVDQRCWSVAHRLRDMDADGVGVQVLSPMPGTLLHGADPEGAATLSRAQNDFLAGLVSHAPDRLRALGAVPLQDVAAAAAELRRCVGELGMLGVEVGTRVGGRLLSDPVLDPFFSVAAELQALVFVHPVDGDVEPALAAIGLGFGAGMPTETGIAGAALLSREVDERRRPVRLCLAHGGGSLPALLPRLDAGERLRDRGTTRVAGDRAGEIFCDSLTYDTQALATVVDKFGPDHVLLGSDYPFPARERPAGRAVDAAAGGLPDQVRAAIGRDNACTLFPELRTAGPPPALAPTEKGPSWQSSSASA